MKKVLCLLLFIVWAITCIHHIAVGQQNGNFNTVRVKAGNDTATFSPQPNGTLLYGNGGNLYFKTSTYWQKLNNQSTGGGGTPGGSTTQLQYNNAGSFGGITGATSNGTTLTMTSPNLSGAMVSTDTTQASRSLWTINNTTNSPASQANYYHSLNQSTIATGRDNVYSIGYNFLGGGRVNSSVQALRIGFESRYFSDTEFHIENITTGGLVNRNLSFNSNITTGVSSGYITSNGFDFRSNNTGTSYFLLSNSGPTVAANGSAPTIQLIGAKTTELKLDVSGNFETTVGGFANDVGQYSINGFNELGRFRGSNTNFYRFYIDNTYNATNTAAGLSLMLKSTEKGYLYASGSTRSLGDNIVLHSGSSSTGLLLGTNNTSAITILGANQRVGVGVGTPTGVLHLKAGTATASTAPLKFTSGTNLTTPEAGAVEYDGSKFYFTSNSGTPARNFSLSGLGGTTQLVSGAVDLRANDTGANFGIQSTAVGNSISLTAPGSTGHTITVAGNSFSVGSTPNTPTAAISINPGTATAGTAPLKFSNGVALTTPENGAVEYVSPNLTFTDGGVRYALVKSLTGSQTLDFGSTAAGASTDLTITVTGASDGDAVAVGPVNASTLANGVFTAWVSAANTVTVRFTNTNLAAALDPASGTFKVVVFK